jgi:CheY-like chemotaxis protein
MTAPHTILLVEDDPDIREALAWAISRVGGHAVVTAHHGGVALTLLKEGLRPCLILLDLFMPEMDGPTFRQAQLADPALATIPTVVLTALSDAPPMPGVLAWIPKPIETEQLVAMINEMCPPGPPSGVIRSV